MNYYIIGDIHGSLSKLHKLYKMIKSIINDDDILIFLGDYIDRGTHSFEVVEYLISLAKSRTTVFLKGNHEQMLLNYLDGMDSSNMYLVNGGRETIKSYKKNMRTFQIPDSHLQFFKNLKLYYETDNFIAVHAGINPKYNSVAEQTEHDCLWIREKFFENVKNWKKTIIFGHTPIVNITKKKGSVYFDDKKNIIGIDTGAVFGGVLTCLRMPDRTVFQS